MNHRPLARSFAALAILICTLASAAAAEVQYPLGNRLGLAPPPGLQRNGKAPGFFDADRNVSMLLLQLPPQAYLQVEESITTAAAKQSGIIIDHREALFTPAGMALVSAGNDTREHARKWMLVTQQPGFTGVVSVSIPDGARDKYPDASIRAALQSLTVRPPPIAEQLELVPYRLSEMSGFRVVRVLNNNAVILTNDPDGEAAPAERAQVVVGIHQGGPARPSERANFAQALFMNLPGLLAKRITSADAMRLNGQPGYEIRGEASEPSSKAPVKLVQWLRFSDRGYLDVIGVTTAANWQRDFPRFRAIRDGITPR